MNKNEVNKFKKILLNNKRNLSVTIEKMKEQGVSSQRKEEPTELSNYDNHPAEIATELFQTEFNNSLMIHQEHLLEETNNALERVNNGTFGTCEFCSKEIEKERLEAIPYARTCIICEKDKVESQEPIVRNNDRPNEELVLDSPVGRKYLNQQEDDEHEGMDQLYDPVKYGSSDTPQDMGGYHDYEEYYTNKVDKQGVVDHMDNFSNKDYTRQIPD
jgi:YteA family regulatory protein